MKKAILFCVASWCLSTFAASHTFHFGTHRSVRGETLEVDARGLILNGRRILPVMGEIHYSRVPAHEWQREIRKMRAGGVTMIATYCFWNHHEEPQGVWNWSGNRNLRSFLSVCRQEGMPVVLRIGPFCHGEVYQGGLPEWIVRKAQEDKAQYQLRSEAPGFLAATEELYTQIFRQAEGLLWKDGGPVVGVQLENECRGPWSYYMRLKDMAVRIGFDVPFYTRTGWPKLNGREEFGQLLPLYGDYADGFWDRVLTDMPGEYAAAFRMKQTRISGGIATETFGTQQDTRMEKAELAYPYLTCELGGGMMPSYHRRIHITGREAMPLAICKLGSGSNLPGYYMYHGGTNPTHPLHTMAETQASAVTNYNDMPLLSYDFQAPLGEMGQPNLTAFHQTRLLHQFLADWGGELAAMDVDTLSEHYARRGCFEFRNDYVRMQHEEGVSYVRPVDMPWRGHRLTAQAQPFCQVGDTLYLVAIPGTKSKVWLDGRPAASPLIRILDAPTARRAYKIGGRMLYARHDGGILYTAGDTVREESWHSAADVTPRARITSHEGVLRQVSLGAQKVAAMPVDADFEASRTYDLDLSGLTKGRGPLSDLFLSIHYAADCARVYADGCLVADNFWNGKPMLVRLSDLAGKKVQLRILPLSKQAPIYLQQQQKERLMKARGEALLELDSIVLLERRDEVRELPRCIRLDGMWRFGTESTVGDSILLPGSMPQRLKGNVPDARTQWVGAIYDSSFFHNPYMEKYRREGDTLRLPFFLTPVRHYVGKAWYERTVNLPEGQHDRRYRLFLERPHIATEVWVNGQHLGRQNSLSVPHVYDLDEVLRPRDNVLRICVDNRLEAAQVGQDSHSVTDQTQGNWNGIVGRIELQPWSAVAALKVYPDVDGRQAKVRVRLDDSLLGETVSVALRAEAFNTPRRHVVSAPPRSVRVDSCEVELTLDMGEGMLLWDEYAPQLYRLRVEVQSREGSYAASTDFGMRKVEARGKMFYVNGRRVQLRGTVENCCFPLTGYPPTDVESWQRVFEKCKAWGLNHVRFHSYCPPEAAFQAADRAGIYLQPEGPSWPNHGVKLGRGEFIDTYLFDESLRITETYGNHPSFCFFAFGNEPAGNWVKWCNEKMPLIEQHDPRHLYAGFSVGGGWAWQPMAQYAVKAGARGLDTWTRNQPEALSDFSEKINTYNGKDMPGTPITIPFVSHETGQWCVFPNFAERAKYTGVNKARNLDIFQDLMRRNGMESRAADFHLASGKLQALCYKYELERHLRTPDYAGFQLLALNDYTGQGTALVGLTDVFYDDKAYITASEFREFCSDIVPLARISKFTYLSGETFQAELLLSWFASRPCRQQEVQWSVCGPELAEEGTMQVADTCEDGLLHVGQLSVPLHRIKQAGKYTLSVILPGTEARNHWDFWVYPEQAEEPSGDILVTDTLDRRARRTLERGGKVLLLAAGKVSYGREVKQQFLPVFWNTSWFKMRPPHTTGLFIDTQHPILAQFPTDSHSDLQWWELVNKAQVMLFSDFPSDFQPIVQSIDTWFVSRKIGMLFEARVGKGRLVMTTMDLSSRLDTRHAARQMRHSILAYMRSDRFDPALTLDLQRVSDLFTKVAGEVDMFTHDSPDELKPKLK